MVGSSTTTRDKAEHSSYEEVIHCSQVRGRDFALLLRIKLSRKIQISSGHTANDLGYTQRPS